MRTRILAAAFTVVSLLPALAGAQCVSLTASGVAYTQNFDTLVNTGTSSTVPAGWAFLESSGNTVYTAGTGSGNGGDTYSFGTGASTDRAFGTLLSGSNTPTVGACYVNNTGGTLTSLAISYVGEQWRVGALAREDRLEFSYSLDATTLATASGTWTAVTALNFVAPTTTGTIGALDGNAPANRASISSTISSLSIPNGAQFWIRWTDFNASGSDDGLAVDDFSLTPTAVGAQPNLSVNDVSQSEGNSGTTSFTFTVSLTAPAGEGGVAFDIATADGTATTANNDYAANSLTGVTIPEGSSSTTFTVTVSGDTAVEGNETFFVNVTNVTGANVTDGQGVGTITNDDIGVDLTINSVSLSEGNSGTTTFTFTVSLSGPAPMGGVTFDIATANGTATTANNDYVAKTLTGQTIAEGLSSYTFDVTVNGDDAYEANETFSVNVTNIINAVPLTPTGTGTINNDDAPRIHDVQGSGNTSPFSGQVVTVDGIVTFISQGPNTLLGYFIQEPDATVDADPATSEGIFVFTNATPASVNIGDLVRVTGTVTEFGTAPNTLTEIGTPTLTPTTLVLSSNNGVPAFINVTLPVAAVGDLERYEGMRVRFNQTLTVSDHENLPRFGEIVVTADGRAMQATQVVDPNDNPATGNTSTGATNVAAVNAYEAANARSAVIIDGSHTTFASTVPFLDPMTNTIRLGTTVSDVTGVLAQLGGTHRVYPDVAPVFTYAPRPAAPSLSGNVKVAGANVLNYFNGDGAGGGFPTSRGADSLVEFNRQRAKIIAAISGLGADVVGLIEIENDGDGATSAIQDLVNGLNAAQGSGTWAFVADPVQFNGSNAGTTDEIKNAIIYKPAVVSLDGPSSALIDSAFGNARAPVAQTFIHIASGEKFTVVANHFKSKGSGSGLDADQNDGQAASNHSRRLQAQALVSFINGIAATTPRVIALGDLNAYAQEDPIDILRAAGLVELIPNDYSYLFGGRSGSLDHAFGTTALQANVSGAAHWHINADEPEFLDYNVENKNHPNCVTTPCSLPDLNSGTPYRAADHDPLIVALQFTVSQCLAGTYSATGNAPCTQASPGNFVPMAGATSQTACLAGTYQPNSGATTCLSADAGSYATGPGATMQTACNAGTFSSASGAASCTPASPGNFVGMSGATGQTQCLAGNFQANSGATACDPAAAGNFVDTPGSSTQTQCAAGAYQPNTGSITCIPADAGSYATGPAATMQTACAAGSYSSTSGAATCTPASPGNFVAMSGATGQTQCMAGSFQTNSGATGCDPAGAGNFVAAPGSSTQTQCASGSYQPNTGSTACLPADAGSFVDATGAITQTACLAGSYSSATGASACTPASAGNFVAGPGATGQTACGAGSYQGSSGQTSCTLASPGFFVPMSGATTQTACLNGTTSLVQGATACIPLFTVTPSAGTGGSIAPATPQSVAQGQSASFTLVPDSGYRIANVTGTCGGTLTGAVFNTSATTTDCSVVANFVPLLTFNIVLEGAQETPPNASTGAGSGTAVVDTIDNTITLNLTFDGVIGTVNNAHLHGPADRGTAAGVKIGIGQTSPITDVVTYSEADEADILAGKWYVNIHSTAYPGGELRGQLDNLGAADKLLTVATTGTGSGAVTATGINCPGDCSESYPDSTQVMLTATPATGSTFGGWSGACTGSGSCTVTMDLLKSVTATFTLNIYTVTASAGSNGSISPSGNVAANHGTAATFSVTPNAGYTANVGGTCGGTLSGNTYTSNAITGDCTVTASFILNTYALTVAVNGSGSGTVTGAGISCPGDCSETLDHGSVIALTATASTSSTFNGWSGACSGTGSCSITMDSAKSVSATFTLNSYTVTPGAGANGSISPATAQTISHGATTTFTVTPSAGYSASVGGTCGGSLAGNLYTTAAIIGNCTVDAVFTFIPVAPDAPVIGTAIAGNGQATVNFTPPGFDGGTVITGYTATCGTQSVAGTGSPLTVTGLTNFVTVNCSVIATNSAGSSPASATVSVTPQPDLALSSVVSRKTHGAAGTYDVVVDTAIAIGGAVTVESRAIGAGHTILFQFNVPITAAGTAAVVDATSASGGSASAVQVGNDVVVTLTGVTDNQRVLVTLAGVNGTGNFEAAIGFLIGDINNSRSVNATDIAGIKARSGQTTDASNFRFDLNASGGINATDIAAVKARSGLVLP